MPARRRLVLPLVLAALLPAALVACAPGGSPLTSPTPPEDPEVAAENAALVPAAEGATGYPLTLASPYGETVLTERPERIAVVGGDGDLDAVLALGVAPVIAPDDTDAPWYDGTRADEVPGYFDPDDDFSVSRIVASEPDLIVASSMPGLEEHYADLARVAPVVAAGESGAVAVDWRDLTRAVGAAIDAPGAASTAVESADAAIASAAAAHPRLAGRSVSVLVNDGSDGGLRLLGTPGSPAAAFLTGLGVTPAPNAGGDLGGGEPGQLPVSNLSSADADVLVVCDRGGSGSSADARAWLEAEPAYQALGSVQRGGAVHVAPDADSGEMLVAWAVRVPTVLSAPWAAAELASLVEPALPG